jgi:dephospho-CoA kinase
MNVNNVNKEKYMRVLGVTGGTGTGKSTVCKILEEQGGVIIDADKIASAQQRKGCNAFNEIVSYFGEEVLLPDGELNRTLLAGIVFSDNEKLRVLNAIVHKYVSLEMKERVAKAAEQGAKFAVLDVPIPIENGFFDTADCVWAVVANDDLRTERVMARSGISEREAQLRIAAQMTNREYSELADVTIDNEGDFESLKKLVLYELERFLNYFV